MTAGEQSSVSAVSAEGQEEQGRGLTVVDDDEHGQEGAAPRRAFERAPEHLPDLAPVHAGLLPQRRDVLQLVCLFPGLFAD